MNSVCWFITCGSTALLLPSPFVNPARTLKVLALRSTYAVAVCCYLTWLYPVPADCRCRIRRFDVTRVTPVAGCCGLRTPVCSYVRLLPTRFSAVRCCMIPRLTCAVLQFGSPDACLILAWLVAGSIHLDCNVRWFWLVLRCRCRSLLLRWHAPHGCWFYPAR